MAGITDLLTDSAALDALMKQLSEGDAPPQTFTEVMGDIQHDPNISDKNRASISHADLINMIKADPRFAYLPIGENPSAWLDPSQTSQFSRERLPKEYIPEENRYTDVNGIYEPDLNRVQVYADPKRFPADLLNTLAHENVHRTTMTRGLHRQPEGTTPHLRGEITAAYRKHFPGHSYKNINYGDVEPVAWASAQEATTPAGQDMPIQSEMSGKGLGTLYALMTTPGAVATSWDGGDIEHRNLPISDKHLDESYPPYAAMMAMMRKMRRRNK